MNNYGKRSAASLALAGLVLSSGVFTPTANAQEVDDNTTTTNVINNTKNYTLGSPGPTESITYEGENPAEATINSGTKFSMPITTEPGQVITLNSSQVSPTIDNPSVESYDITVTDGNGDIIPGITADLTTNDTTVEHGFLINIPVDFSGTANIVYKGKTTTQSVTYTDTDGVEQTWTGPENIGDEVHFTLTVYSWNNIKNPAYNTFSTKINTPRIEQLLVDQTNPETVVPEGTVFAVEGEPPTGWENLSVNQNTGSITATPSPSAEPGETTIRVTYPDNSTETVTVNLDITPSDSDINSPSYNTVNVVNGNTITSPVITEQELPEGTTYSIPAEHIDPQGVTTTIDDNGNISITVAEDAPIPGGIIYVPVKITYPDNSSTIVQAGVTIIESSNRQHTPSYDTAQTIPGRSIIISQEGDQNVPEGTTYSIGDHSAEGWLVTINSDNGEITAVPGIEAEIGNLTIPVTVTYPDNSVSHINSVVTLNPNQAMTNEPEYQAPQLIPGQQTTIQQISELPDDVVYTLESYTPEDWTITVDNVTGDITAQAPPRYESGHSATAKIKVTYADESTDTIEVVLDVIDNEAMTHNPSYHPAEVKPGNFVTIPQSGDDQIVNAVFSLEQDNYDGWTVSINEYNGVITATSPSEYRSGYSIEVPVIITYQDGSTETVNAVIRVIDNETMIHNPSYPQGEAKPGETSRITQTGDQLPNGSTYHLSEGYQAPEGWTVNVNTNTGSLNVTTPELSQPDDFINVDLTIRYPDGSVDNTTTAVTVIPNDAMLNNPSYDDGEAKPGNDYVTSINNEGKPVPQGTGFTVNQDIPEGWLVNVNRTTGEIRVTISEDAPRDITEEFTVTVTYPDGSTDTVYLNVTVIPNDSMLNTPSYDNAGTKPGIVSTTELDNVNENGDPLPEGTTFTLVDTPPRGWIVIVNLDGTLRVTPPADSLTGDSISPSVRITYPDNSVDIVNHLVTVESTDALNYSPNYVNSSLKPGNNIVLQQTGDEVPDGTKFHFSRNYIIPEGWDVRINESTGDITVTPLDAAPGDRINIPVTVTYPDNFTDSLSVSVTLINNDAMNNPINYDSQVVKPGKEIIINQTLPQADNAVFSTNYSGDWGVTINPDNGQLTVTAPENLLPGQFTTIPVTAVYDDDSSNSSNITIRITPNDAMLSVPSYPDGSTKPGSQLLVKQNGSVVNGATYRIDDNNAIPDNWVVSVANNGDLRVTPSADATIREQVTIPVIVSYPDNSYDTVNVKITVSETDAIIYNPSYDSGQVKPGETTVLKQSVSLPENVTYTISEDYVTPEGWSFSINNESGIITVTSPMDSQPGDRMSLPVTISYADGSTDNIESIVTVSPNDAMIHSPEYTSSEAKPGKTVSVNPIGVPEGSTYRIASSPVGWVTTISPDGVLRITTSPNDQQGKVGEIIVTITYPDGSQESITSSINVIPNDAMTHNPEYQGADILPGQNINLKQNAQLPDGTRISLATGFLVPAGWSIGLDPDGSLNVTPPSVINGPGSLTIPVNIAYPDGSSERIEVPVNVVPNDAMNHNPEYDMGSGIPGSRIVIEQISDLPDGSTFELSDDNNIPVSWRVRVSESTGEITVTVPLNANRNQLISIPVNVTYPDGSQEIVEANAKVNPDMSMTYNPIYPLTTVNNGATTNVRIVSDVPEDATFTLNDIPSGWTVTINDSGVLNITAPDNATEGTIVSIPVTITYSDESVDNVNADIVVKEIDQVEEPEVIVKNPNYSDSRVDAGGDTVIKQTGTVSEGSLFRLQDNYQTPTGWVITIEPNSGDLNVTVPENTSNGYETRIPVKVIYSDGSESSTLAKVTVTSDVNIDDGTLAENNRPSYSRTVIEPGYQVTIKQETVLPTVVFSLKEDYVVPQGWNITINESNGEISVSSPENAVDGEITIPVVVNYSDGSMDNLNVVVEVDSGSEPVNDDDDNNNSGSGDLPINIDKDTGDTDNYSTSSEDTDLGGSKDTSLAKTGTSTDVVAGGLLATLLTGLLGFFGLRRKQR